MSQQATREKPTLRRPNTIKFNVRHLHDVTPQGVYDAICKDINTMEAVKRIAALENNWYNVNFDNEYHCQRFALQGIRLGNTLLQCERTNVINSAVVYIKSPYEMTDEVVTNVLLQY